LPNLKSINWLENKINIGFKVGKRGRPEK